MGEDRDRPDPMRDAIKGVGLLFRAGKSAAGKLKKELDQSSLSRSLDDAGKELARAATNVVERITEEAKKVTRRDGDAKKPPGDDDPR